MYERSLNEAELILGTHKNPLVPVREVWEEVVRRSRVEGFEVASLADFVAMLEADRRFQIIPAHNEDTKDLELPPEKETDEEMEKLGFYSEDRVRLRMTKVAETELEGKDKESQSVFKQTTVVKKSAVRKKTSKKKTAKRKRKNYSKNKKVKRSAKQKKVRKHRRVREKKQTRK